MKFPMESPRYDVVFRHDGYPQQRSAAAIIAEWLPTLEAAREARKLSGDLVVFSGTMEVVNDERWLFEREKSNPNCYARRAMQGK